MDVRPGHDSARDEGVQLSATDPRCWLRGEAHDMRNEFAEEFLPAFMNPR